MKRIHKTAFFLFAVFSGFALTFAKSGPDDIIVELSQTPGIISAASDFELIPEGIQKAEITAKVLLPDKEKILKNLSLEIIPDPMAFRAKEKKGSTIKDTSFENKWLYIPAKELKSEKNPEIFNIKIIPRCSGKVCGRSITITVRPVFKHLISIHADTPKSELRKPANNDYELAWQYARWKYDIDTSNLDEIVFDPKMKYKGATYAKIFGKKRICKLGRQAFISENICASVLGHENIHGGQSLAMFFGRREKAEPPAYQWEIKNARSLGLPPDYVYELKHWRNAYSEQDRGFRIRLIPW